MAEMTPHALTAKSSVVECDDAAELRRLRHYRAKIAAAHRPDSAHFDNAYVMARHFHAAGEHFYALRIYS